MPSALGNSYSTAGNADAVRDFETSGLGVIAYCGEYRCITMTFIRWRRDFAASSEAGFVA